MDHREARVPVSVPVHHARACTFAQDPPSSQGLLSLRMHHVRLMADTAAPICWIGLASLTGQHLLD